MSKTTEPETLEVKPHEKIFLALPCYGSQQTCGFVRGLIKTQEMGILGQIDWLENDSLVSRARNTLVHRFMHNAFKFDWLMFIDVDLHFDENMVMRLWLQAKRWRERNPSGKWPIFGGLYALKKVRPQFVYNAIQGAQLDPKTRLMPVRETGTGFMLIHRSIFEEMQEKMPELRFSPDDSEPDKRTRYDYFGVGPYEYPDGSRRYLSEDYMFCQRWRDLGGEVLADTGIQIRHQGIATYPFPPEELHDAVRACRLMKHPALPDELV